MRLRLLLLLCLATVVIKKVDSSFVNSKWANVFKNFFGQNDAVVAPVEDSPLDEKDARIKRSILASLGAQINCEPGFTGQFCESPICNSRVIPPAIDAAAARLIDVFYLRQSCAGNVTFPLDSESQFLHIQVLTNEGELNGNVTLIDDQGNVVPCTTGCGGGQYNWPNAAPGQYEIKIYVASSNIIYCDVEVSTYTALAADVGFVYRPNEDAFEKGLAFNTPQYIVVHPYYLIQPATINAIYIFENQRDRTRYVSRLQPRYGCGYEYYTGEFQCDSTMISYRWVVEGIDYRGFLWRRAGTFSCAQQVTTSPPPTTAPPQPDYCMNGGTLYNNSNGISSCYCGEFFTGFNCANALCMNGGTPSFDAAICLCPGGYSGSHCADVQCQYDLIDNEYLTDKKSLIIVVRQSSAIQAQIPGIISSINMTVNMNFGGTEVFSNFILVVYGNNEALTTQYYASEFSSFLLALQLIGTGGAWSNNCTDDVIAGITSVFSALVIYHKSPIFVFTDVPPNDAADWRNVYEPNSFRKLPIYTFFLTDSTTLCYNQTDTLSQGYQTLQDISIVTGGLLFTPSVANYASLFRHTLIRTTYQANYITFNEMSKCSMSDRQSFIVDRSATNVYILATGINMALTITDPSWNVLNSTQLVSVVNDGRNFIWEFLDYTPGQYLYFIQSTGGGTNAPCSFRVVAKSNVDMFVGASAGLLGDMSLPDPVYGYSANMVVHFNGFVGRTIDPFRLFAEMQIDAWNRNQMFNQPIYYSSGIWRDGCKFHLYFGGFSCPVQEQRYIVTVFADDEVGYPIQRSWPAYCVPAFFNTNTTVPPNGQCFNGGVPNPMNASSCICPHNWTGQNCTIIVCDNNGTSMGSYCQCPALTEGPYCERLVCQSPQPGINFDAGNRALAFVLNVRSTMNNSLQDVANTAANLVRDLFVADGRYISYFIVATFNQAGGSVVSVTAANQYNLFIQSLNDAVAASNNQPAVDPSNCTGQISMAIVDVITNIRRLNLGQSQVFIYTDSDFGNITLTDAQALISAQDTSTTLNFVVTNYNLCGAPNGGVNGPSDLMKEMARGTAGLIYYTQHSGSIMGIIPTFYSSGLIAGAESSDCNANPIVYYLPIDGWSQSFLITALGAGVTISVTPPAGANMYDYLNEIDKDDYIHVNQYVIPCDATGMVTSKDQYCYIIHSVEKYSWYQSRDNCRKDEAYIVDIPTQEINDFFSVQVGNTALWIGLYRDPGTNQWHWDNYNYVNLTFNNNTDYSNWGDNEPSANGDCVVSKPNAQGVQKWYMDNCNATYSYMCQKHKYGQTIMPRDPSTNRLPPGIWQLKVSSNATGTNASCFFEARIQSQIQVYYGYVSDIHSDYPASYGNILTNGNYYAAHTTGLEPLNANNVIDQTDGHLNYALIFNPNGSLYYSATFQERRICTYPQISQGFACPGYKQTTQKTNFFVKFSGIDQYGNLFERYAATFCTGTTYCVNGYLSNGACICEAYWQGASCETPICLNGGTVNGGSCTCPAELGGPNCQYPNCQDPQKITFNDTGVTLAILLETSSKTGSTLFYLRNNLARIIANVTSNQVTSSQWISNYMLYPFDSASNEQYWYPPVVSNTFDAINTALNNISTFNGCPGPNGANGVCASGSSCPRPILRVLNNVLKDPSFKNPNSIVIIITASNIGDYGALNDVHETAETMRATINIIVVDSAAPCGNFSYTSPETTALYLLAQMTGGDFFYSSGKSVVANLLPYYLPTLYRTAHLGTIFVQNCSDETVYFPIDSGTQAFSVSYTGPGAGGLTMTVTDSNNTVVPLPEGYQLYEYTYFAAFDYLNTLSNPPGTWKLEVKSTARNCVLTVRLRSTIEVFAGFTNQTDSDLLAGALKDNPRALLAVDTPNGIILHANNLGNGTLNYVQIYGGGDRVLFSSELIKRIGCNYEWWAPSSFTCAYGLYIVSVSGIDRRGQNFIRNIPVQCTAPYPPPPTEPRCDTTQAVYDIALILDISTKASSYGASTWSDFTAALSRALGNYYPAGGSFSSAGTRLAIIGVAGIANTKLFNNFAESDGKKIADLLINVQQNQADYGQNLPSAITILQQLVTNPNSGYRSGAQYPNVRHLAIYATLNGAQTEGGTPADDVHSLRRSGVFGFAVVAYNATYSDTATKFNLETLASFPCLYFAIDSPINTYIPYYINDITCVRTPQCGEAAQNETGRFFLN